MGQVNVINRVDPKRLPPCWTVPPNLSDEIRRPGRGHYVFIGGTSTTPHLTTNDLRLALEICDSTAKNWSTKILARLWPVGETTCRINAVLPAAFDDTIPGSVNNSFERGERA